MRLVCVPRPSGSLIITAVQALPAHQVTPFLMCPCCCAGPAHQLTPFLPHVSLLLRRRSPSINPKPCIPKT